MAKRTAPGPGGAGRAADRLREGLARQEAGDLAGAEACFRGALADAPDQPRALGLLGTVQLQAGHPDAAAATFRHLTGLAPGNADGHHCLGLCLGAMGREADPEGHSRRMIDFLELPWDDACLRFHESGRAVATASYDQVRRPVSRGSAGRWRHYERHLGPLLTALGDTR